MELSEMDWTAQIFKVARLRAHSMGTTHGAR